MLSMVGAFMVLLVRTFIRDTCIMRGVGDVEQIRRYAMVKLIQPCAENTVINKAYKENNSTIWELLSPEQKRAINKMRDAK